MNLVEILMDRAGALAGKTAIAYGGRRHTYGELAAAVREHAALLARLGVCKGDRVALMLPKSMEFIYLHLAVLALGAITLPLNPAYTAAEVAYFLTDAGSSLLFTDRAGGARGGAARAVLVDDPADYGSLLSEVREGPGFAPDYPTGADDTAMICYTSGTTGRPKGAMITHRNLASNTAALHEAWRWSEDDVLLHALPLFHVHGLCVALHGSLWAGSTVVMHERFDPVAVCRALGEERCTMFMGVPTMYARLAAELARMRWEPGAMRVFISGSAPLKEHLFRYFEELTGFRILERYGMTEAQMIASNPYEPARRIPGSVGYPLPGVAVRVTGEGGEDAAPGEIGEVWVSGANVFRGYWQRPQETARALAGPWLKTGDLGFLDPRDGGRLYLVGRARELVISGGFNVYPKEVENVLDDHAAVRESAVFGLPDDDLGERVVAAVVLREGKVQAQELIARCREQLVGYKCPKEIFFVPELPRNAMGKVQKRVLRQTFEPSS